MADDSEEQAVKELVQRLVREIGITEAQGRNLVATMGMNWPSLVFNARSLKNQK